MVFLLIDGMVRLGMCIYSNSNNFFNSMYSLESTFPYPTLSASTYVYPGGGTGGRRSEAKSRRLEAGGPLTHSPNHLFKHSSTHSFIHSNTISINSYIYFMFVRKPVDNRVRDPRPQLFGEARQPSRRCINNIDSNIRADREKQKLKTL